MGRARADFETFLSHFCHSVGISSVVTVSRQSLPSHCVKNPHATMMSRSRSFLVVLGIITQLSWTQAVKKTSEYRLGELRHAETEVWDRMIQEETSSIPPPPLTPPTPAPTSVDPLGPTVGGGCALGVETTCILENGDPCGNVAPTLIPCDGPPLVLGMRFNGGGCDQSQNEQGDKFYCEDFQGGPPTDSGSQSYIVASDANNQGTTFFEGWVGVGGYFNVTAGYPASETSIDPDVYLNVYNSQDKTETNLIQLVRLDGSCASPLNLGNAFGASQVVFWFNEAQGLITAFQSIIYDITVVSADSVPITLSSLVLDTSFAGTIDLSKSVEGDVLSSGDSIQVPIPTNIDVTVLQSYTFSTQVSGTTGGSDLCTGSNDQTYDIGIVPPVA